VSTDIDTDLAEAITAVTGLALPPDVGFFEAGVTSAHVVTIHELVQRSLGREFPVTAFFRHPTRRALAAVLAAEAGHARQAQQAVLPERPSGRIAQARRDIRARIRDRQR
jgi:iturin family lipopeptide synthetase A